MCEIGDYNAWIEDPKTIITEWKMMMSMLDFLFWRKPENNHE